MSQHKPPPDIQQLPPALPARPEPPLRDDFHQERLRIARELRIGREMNPVDPAVPNQEHPVARNPEVPAERNNVPPPIVRGEGYRATLEAHRVIPPSERGR